MMGEGAYREPPKGPWSDLPPRGPQPSRPPPRKPAGRRRLREPIINNWRGLAIILFLLFVAPILVRWVSAMVIGLIPGLH